MPYSLVCKKKLALMRLLSDYKGAKPQMNLKEARRKVKAGSLTIILLRGTEVITGDGASSSTRRVTSRLEVKATLKGDSYTFFYDKKPFRVHSKAAIIPGKVNVEHQFDIKKSEHSVESLTIDANKLGIDLVTQKRKPKGQKFKSYFFVGDAEKVVTLLVQKLNIDFLEAVTMTKLSSAK